MTGKDTACPSSHLHIVLFDIPTDSSSESRMVIIVFLMSKGEFRVIRMPGGLIFSGSFALSTETVTFLDTPARLLSEGLSGSGVSFKASSSGGMDSSSLSMQTTSADTPVQQPLLPSFISR